jgi:hypothetical protein
MSTWVLIIFVYAGVMSESDSVAIRHVDGFKNKQACEHAAKSVNLTNGTMKDERKVCVEVK